jgi:hypothetical protein
MVEPAYEPLVNFWLITLTLCCQRKYQIMRSIHQYRNIDTHTLINTFYLSVLPNPKKVKLSLYLPLCVHFSECGTEARDILALPRVVSSFYFNDLRRKQEVCRNVYGGGPRGMVN